MSGRGRDVRRKYASGSAKRKIKEKKIVKRYELVKREHLPTYQQ